jgi:hypothetical protein
LPLIDNATLNSIFLCRSDHTGVHLPVPERLLVMARGYQYKDAAFVSTVGRGGNIDIRGFFTPTGIQSDSWVEVTHCPVGAERENLWFYRMPGSGLSIFTGRTQTFARRGRDNLPPNLDTAHWTNAPGPGQELVRLNTGKLGGLGVRGKRISGRDLVAMGHMKCGQPPDVRDCRPDDVAARLHTECAGWYGAVCELLRNLLRQPPRHRADAVIFDFPTGTRRTPSSVSPTRTAYQCSTRLLIEASTSARRRGATRSFEPLRGAGAY